MSATGEPGALREDIYSAIWGALEGSNDVRDRLAHQAWTAVMIVIERPCSCCGRLPCLWDRAAIGPCPLCRCFECVCGLDLDAPDPSPSARSPRP